VRAENLTGVNRGSRFYPLLYLLTRVHGARDFDTGLPLSSHLLGRLASLEVHHVFPKALLARHGYDTAARNAIANFAFLTQETNLAIGSQPPATYFPSYESKNPGVLVSQWVPTDPDLWRPERYEDFLAARRELLADAANELLEALRRGGDRPAEEVEPQPVARVVVADPDAVRLAALAQEATGHGLARAELDYEIVDPDTGELQARADLAWPDGLRQGLTDPVAYLLEPDEDMERRLGQLGFRFFVTEEPPLRHHFEEVLGVDLDHDGVIGPPADEDRAEPSPWR
jgi:hypothetical protein